MCIRDSFWTALSACRLTYGEIAGSDALREGICKLYRAIQPHQVIPTHGACLLYTSRCV